MDESPDVSENNESSNICVDADDEASTSDARVERVGSDAMTTSGSVKRSSGT